MSTIVRPVLKYVGSKGRVAKQIVGIIMQYDADVYVEAFGGSLAVLLAKPKHKKEIINDIDQEIYNFYTCLVTNPRRLIAIARNLIPHKKMLQEECLKPHSAYWRAAWWWWRQCHRAGGTADGGITITGTTSWKDYFPRAASVSDRLRSVGIECTDWREMIAKYDSPRTVFYLDPPYIPDTRTKKLYREERMTIEDHEALVHTINQIEGFAVVSGYHHQIYDEGLKTFDMIEIETFSSAHVGASKTQAGRTEVVWFTPNKESLF